MSRRPRGYHRPRHHPKTKCKKTGKVRFRDEATASKALSRLDKGQVRSYYCYECKGWHHTSLERNPRED